VNKVVSDALPNVVFHLAALHFIPHCNANPAQTLQVNVVGTQNLLEACRRHQPEKVIIASTAAVYSIRDRANGEEDEACPIDIYGLSKWMNEKQLELYATHTNTRCCAARLFNIFGPGETNAHVVPELMDQVAAGEGEIAVGNIKPKRDYVYVTDAARALLIMAEKCAHAFRVYNVGTGKEHSVEEIIEELSRISGRTLKLSVDAERVRSSDRLHLLCDLARTSGELGWLPQFTLESGLRALWQHRTALQEKPHVIYCKAVP
jgi:UDP-glucose 4-epimerase